MVSFQVQGPTLASMLLEQFIRQKLCVGTISDMIVDHLEVSKNFFNTLAHGPNISVGLPTLFEVNGQNIYTTTSIAGQAVLLSLWVSVNLTDLGRLKKAGGKVPQTEQFALPLFVRLGCFI